MIPPAILAHGSLSVVIAIGVLWVLFTYGLPLLVRVLTKRKRKVAAIVVGIPTVALTGFVTLFYLLESESLFFLLLIGVIPFLLSLITLVQAIRLRTTA